MKEMHTGTRAWPEAARAPLAINGKILIVGVTVIHSLMSFSVFMLMVYLSFSETIPWKWPQSSMVALAVDRATWLIWS